MWVYPNFLFQAHDVGAAETCGWLGGGHLAHSIAIDPGVHGGVQVQPNCLIRIPRFVTNSIAEGHVMSREKRKHPRRPLDRAAWVRLADGSTISCKIRDISEGGARLSGGGVHDVPDHFVLSLSIDHKVSRRCRVVRRTDYEIGVQFTASGESDAPMPSELPCDSGA